MSRHDNVIKNQAMMTYRGMDVQLHAFLNSTLDGNECSASRPDRFSDIKCKYFKIRNSYESCIHSPKSHPHKCPRKNNGNDHLN